MFHQAPPQNFSDYDKVLASDNESVLDEKWAHAGVFLYSPNAFDLFCVLILRSYLVSSF